MRLAFATALVLGSALVGVGCSPDGHRDHAPPSLPEPSPCSSATTCGACTPILGCGWCQYADGTGACTSGPSRCKGDTFRWNWEPTSCPVVDAGADAPSDAAPSDADAATDSGTAADGAAADGAAADGAAADGADGATTDGATTDGATTDGATTDGGDAGDPDAGDAAEEADAIAADAGSTDAPPDSAPPVDAGACGTVTPPTACAITSGGTLCKAGQYTVGCLGAAAPTGCAIALAKPGESYWCCACK